MHAIENCFIVRGDYISHPCLKDRGYYVYFTSECTITVVPILQKEPVKFKIGLNGESKVISNGVTLNSDMGFIQEYIKNNYKRLYDLYKVYADTDPYRGFGEEV